MNEIILQRLIGVMKTEKRGDLEIELTIALIKSICEKMEESGCTIFPHCRYRDSSRCVDDCHTPDSIEIIERVMGINWFKIKQVVGIKDE